MKLKQLFLDLIPLKMEDTTSRYLVDFIYLFIYFNMLLANHIDTFIHMLNLALAR